MTMADIAEQLEVPIDTFRDWYRAGKWPDIRKKLEVDLKERIQAETAKIIAEHKPELLKRHLRVGEKIENQIERTVDAAAKKDSPMKPADLLDTAKAFQASGLVSGKAAGVDGKDNQGGVGNVNVLIHTGFTPTPVVQPSIDVDPAEDDDEGDPF